MLPVRVGSVVQSPDDPEARLLGAQKLLYLPHVVANAQRRPALEHFYLDVIAAQTYDVACAVDSMPREESMLLIGEVCLIPLSATDLASDEGRALAVLVGRFSQNFTDLLTICTGATDVHEFSQRRGGIRPRQMAARQAEAAKDASK